MSVMKRLSGIVQAKTNKLLDKAEAGEEVVITRQGRPVVQLAPVHHPKGPLRSLVEFRARMPKWRLPSAVLLRQARDEER